MQRDPYTDETPQYRIDPCKALQPRQRSEAAGGGGLNTSAEVAAFLRKLDKEKAAKTALLGPKAHP
jgi:hypothetical protein